MSNLIDVNDSNFEAEVLRSDKPVLVDFGAVWCSPCQKQLPLIKTFAENNEDLKVCKLDTDDSSAIPKQYKIRSVPTLLLFKDGKLLGSKVGLTSLAELSSFVKDKLG
jgi:thioredoxin 1